MISKDKDRIITSIPKEMKDKLERMSKETGVSKSAIVSLALVSFFSGTKLGEAVYDKVKGDDND